MKTFKKVLSLILAVTPLICTATAVFFILPDTVAAHFGVNGTPDRYGSKYEAFILPAIILALYLIYFFCRKLIFKSSADDNNRAERNLDITDTVIMLVLVMMNALNIFLLSIMAKPEYLKDKESTIFVIISAVIGIMFIVIGNIMPKTRRNSVIGMRMPFCMDTDEHWYIANRAGGVAMVISGLVTVISGLIVRNGSYIIYMIIALILSLTVASIYSYAIIKGENKK